MVCGDTGAAHLATAALLLTIGIFVGLGGILVCSFLGGMRAVTWTQVAQYIILIIAYLIPVIMLAYRNTGIPVPHVVYGYTLQKVTQKEQELVSDAADRVQPHAQHAVESAKGMAQEVAQDLKEPAQEAAQSVKETAQSGAQEVKSQGQGEAQQLKSSAQGSAQSVKDETKNA